MGNVGLGMVTVFYIAIAISGLLTLFVGINEILRAPWSNMGFSILLYGSIGLAIGVYRKIFQKISRINSATLEIKRTRDS